MRTQLLCVMIHIGIKVAVGTVKCFEPSSIFTDLSKAVLLFLPFLLVPKKDS